MADGNGLALLEERLVKSEKIGAFDPSQIMVIINMIMTMLQDCKKPKPAALRRRLFNRARLASGLYEQVAGWSWSDSMKKANDIFDLADKASNEELQSLIDDCCSP